jgi:hypothetical protein
VAWDMVDFKYIERNSASLTCMQTPHPPTPTPPHPSFHPTP